MIISGAKSQIGGQASFDWQRTGLVCTLALPCAEARNITRRGIGGKLSKPGPATAKPRILIVEDEPLVAMMLSSFLDQLSCTAVGPCATPFEALSLLRESTVDAALLDVNLGGETVYPVADALARIQVPFAFLTGYGGESIEPRFTNVPRLEKPVGLEQLSATVRALSAAAPVREKPAKLRS